MNIFEVLNFSDVMFCMVAAFVVTWVIGKARIFIGLVRDDTKFEYNPSEFNKAIEKCYSLFPHEIFDFKGTTFRRGLFVRVKTVTEKVIEGTIIGKNRDDVLCIITRTYISAEIIDNISEITIIDKEGR